MLRQTQTPIAATFFLFAICTVPASAQAPAASPGRIHASGQHEIKLAPQKLRLSLAIRAEGVDAKSAIEAFVKHKERVKKELGEMKADEASIEITSPQLSSSMAGMPQAMPGTNSIYYPQPIPPPVPGEIRPENPPKVYMAAAHVKAEWLLPTTDADALAMLPETLKEQITKRDLMGMKNKAKLDPSQQEKVEEFQAKMQEAMSYAMSTSEGQPFTVLFVAKADEEARKNGIKAAYDQAIARAELLAAVTGHKLGDLVSLRCDDTPSAGISDVQAAYAAVSYPGVSMPQTHGDAAVSTSPGGLGIGVKVDVTFAIAK